MRTKVKRNQKADLIMILFCIVPKESFGRSKFIGCCCGSIFWGYDIIEIDLEGKMWEWYDGILGWVCFPAEGLKLEKEMDWKFVLREVRRLCIWYMGMIMMFCCLAALLPNTSTIGAEVLCICVLFKRDSQCVSVWHTCINIVFGWMGSVCIAGICVLSRSLYMMGMNTGLAFEAHRPRNNERFFPTQNLYSFAVKYTL